jgi:transposase
MENRPRYNRDQLRYPSDLTDAEWSYVAPLIPPGKRGGGKRCVDLREVMNAIMYILSTGCQWQAIPKDLPARSTLYDYFDLWSWDGTLERIHCGLPPAWRPARLREGGADDHEAAAIDVHGVQQRDDILGQTGGVDGVGRLGMWVLALSESSKVSRYEPVAPGEALEDRLARRPELWPAVQ